MTEQDRKEFEAWAHRSGYRFGSKSIGQEAFIAGAEYARRTQDIQTAAIQNIIADEYLAKVRELVEAVIKMQQGGYISTCGHYIEEVDLDEWNEVKTLAAALAQLKEQDDD